MNDIIEAISCEREIIQLKLLNVPKHPKMIAKIFSILKDEEINYQEVSKLLEQQILFSKERLLHQLNLEK